MSQLDLSRLQFAMTTIYHFLFVPITIGLSLLVAILHTMWYRSGDPDVRRLTRFFGTLLVINIAIGVVTGLVQEFQFGMNWSAYSRFVGDVFGAPLAMEGLAAFFLESTFLGLWLFGWNVLPARHPPRDRLAGRGRAPTLSAAFIMAANSWMQNPVGYSINETNGRAQLDVDLGRVHQPGVHLGLHARDPGLGRHRRPRHAGGVGLAPASQEQSRALRPHGSPFVGRPAAGLDPADTGRQPARRDRDQVPADEGRRDGGAVGDLLAVLVLGGADRRREGSTRTRRRSSRFRTCSRLLATCSWDGEVQGINELQAQYEEEYGPGDYIPNIFIQYWSMRVMAYLGLPAPDHSAVGLLAAGARTGWQTSRVFLLVAHLGRPDAVRHEHRWLAAHRERPPALGRAGADADRGRRLAVGEHHRGRAEPRASSSCSTSPSGSSGRS